MSSTPRWHARTVAATREAYIYEQLGLPSLLFDAPPPLDEHVPPPYEPRTLISPPRRPATFSFASKHNLTTISCTGAPPFPTYQFHSTKNGSTSTTSLVLCRNNRVIGDLEMGYTQKSGTLSIRGQHFVLTEILTRSNMCVGRGVPWKERQRQALKSVWQWKPGHYTKRIFWDVTCPGTMTCFSSNTWDRATPLAVFHYISTPGVKTLDITPDGYEVMDDIVISALVLERWKLEMVI